MAGGFVKNESEDGCVDIEVPEGEPMRPEGTFLIIDAVGLKLKGNWLA